MSEVGGGPLAGKRILVTRPGGQASGLSALIRAAGGEPLEVPAMEIRDLSDLAAFHAIMTATSARTGTPIRTQGSYRAIWDAFAPSGRVRLLFAVAADGTPEAVLFLVRAGTRVVEPYGGMTSAGAVSRANYLLKWEAIRSSKAAGASSYDMWGLVHPGIRQFKEGFGGREVRLIGAFDLDLRPIAARLYRLAERRRGPRRSSDGTGPGDGAGAG